MTSFNAGDITDVRLYWGLVVLGITCGRVIVYSTYACVIEYYNVLMLHVVEGAPGPVGWTSRLAS